MRIHWILSAFLLGSAVADAAESGAEVTVMTFNLRFASEKPPNAWPARRPVMRACIEEANPDLIGTQEGVYYQLKGIAEDLPQYEWLGLGRDGGSRGEFMAVYYRKDRFEPVEFDHFWLSDTPDVIGSSTWGNSNRRMVTWVKFLDRKSGVQFYFFNTHFDHQIQEARLKSARLLRDRIEGLKTDLPVLLVGDFNAVAGANPAYDVLTQENGLTDAWIVAPEKKGENINTFHGFKGPGPGGSRIDWILFRGGVVVQRMETSTCQREGQFPSDHFPVVAWLKINTVKP